jgi:hypothetical protein
MGGPADGGITSGLNRQGYHAGGNELSTQERLLRAVGPRRSNVYDFLTEWGLNMASMSPQGNVIQTGMSAAKGPHARFLKGKESEENLLRQVALEGEGIDIKAEQAALASEAEAKLKRELLKSRITHEKSMWEEEKKYDTQKQIDAEIEILSSPDGGIYDTIIPAENHANWKHIKSKEYPQDKIGGVLTKKQVADAKTQAKFAKNQAKKNGVGTIYYDPFGDRVLEISIVDNEYAFIPVGDTKGVHEDIPQTIDEAEGQQIEGIATSLGIDYEIIPPRDEKFTGKDWNSYYKRTVNPKAVTLGELKRLISKEKLRLLVERKQKQIR